MGGGSAARNGLGWIALLALGLLGLDGAASRPEGLLLGLPGPGTLLAVLAALVALRLAGARDAWPCAGLLLAALLPLVAPRLPGAAALTGPPLLALAAGGATALLATARPRLRAHLFPVVLILYLAAAWRVQVEVGPRGDEPHYLMVSESLLRDRDLEVGRDFEEGRYRAYHPQPLEPHYITRGRHGEIYSVHAVGLSLLILPAYAIGGYPAVSFFMAILAALLVREIRGLLCAWTGRHSLAEGVAWTLALSPPLVHYAGLVFTEVPAALVLAFVLRRVRQSCTTAGALGWGVALALLPWLNVRYAPFPVLLLAYALSLRLPRRAVATAVLPSVASALAVACYHFVLYGFFDPRLVYGHRPAFAWATLADGLPGLLLDQEFGLLVYAPVLALAVTGLLGRLKSEGRQAALLVTLVAAVMLTAGSWSMWRGGFNPPGRFLVPVVPALAVGLAWQLSSGLGSAPALLLGWSLWTGLVGAAHPALVHRDRDGTAPFFRADSGAEEWTRLLPSYVLAEPDRHRLALVWGGALLLAVPWWRRSRVSAMGLAASSAGLLFAAGAASRISDARTEGRDAVRLLGRPALALPGRSLVSQARWGPRTLTWGPLYEAHRFPDGAPIGNRLALPAGGYTLTLEVDEGLPVATPPVLEVRPEARGAVASEGVLTGGPRLWTGSVVVRPGEGPLRLALRKGGPLVLRTVSLSPSTF